MKMEKNKKIMHKKNTRKIIKKHTEPTAQHWIQSQSRLMKILEASGMTPTKQKMLLGYDKNK